MDLTHALGALLLVFGAGVALFALFLAVRWAIRRFPLPAGNGESVSAGPFGSSPGQAWDRLADLTLKVQTLETGLQLLRQEWDDAYRKIVRERERVRKAAWRAGQGEEEPAPGDDVPQLRLEDLRPMEAPPYPSQLETTNGAPTGAPPPDARRRRFLDKYPEG